MTVLLGSDAFSPFMTAKVIPFSSLNLRSSPFFPRKSTAAGETTSPMQRIFTINRSCSVKRGCRSDNLFDCILY